MSRNRFAAGPSRPPALSSSRSRPRYGGSFLVDPPCGIQFGQRLEREGAADLLVPSGGFVSRNGNYMLRGAVPLPAMRAAMRKSCVKRVALCLLGRFLVPTLPWESGFFAREARQLLAAVRLPVCLLGGVDSLAVIQQAMADGFSCVALARALLREPDFVTRIQREAAEQRVSLPSKCSHCNRCIVGSAMAEMPLRCAELDF